MLFVKDTTYKNMISDLIYQLTEAFPLDKSYYSKYNTQSVLHRHDKEKKKTDEIIEEKTKSQIKCRF